tara:strand:- start:3499 stop:3750 length:252 start_codon:yes stop_codon:yes gene_type:complete
MKKEPTIFIRCSEETNELLEIIRKAEMPVKSRNSQIIYLIHKEARELGITAKTTKNVTVNAKNEESKSGLGALAETKRQAILG